VKQKKKARMGLNPKTQQNIKIPAKTALKFRVAKAAKDGILGGKNSSLTELRKPSGSLIRGDTIGFRCRVPNVMRLPVQGGSAWH
jgi:hypothetical protein